MLFSSVRGWVSSIWGRTERRPSSGPQKDEDVPQRIILQEDDFPSRSPPPPLGQFRTVDIESGNNNDINIRDDTERRLDDGFLSNNLTRRQSATHTPQPFASARSVALPAGMGIPASYRTISRRTAYRPRFATRMRLSPRSDSEVSTDQSVGDDPRESNPGWTAYDRIRARIMAQHKGPIPSTKSWTTEDSSSIDEASQVSDREQSDEPQLPYMEHNLLRRQKKNPNTASRPTSQGKGAKVRGRKRQADDPTYNPAVDHEQCIEEEENSAVLRLKKRKRDVDPAYVPKQDEEEEDDEEAAVPSSTKKRKRRVTDVSNNVGDDDDKLGDADGDENNSSVRRSKKKRRTSDPTNILRENEYLDETANHLTPRRLKRKRRSNDPAYVQRMGTDSESEVSDDESPSRKSKKQKASNIRRSAPKAAVGSDDGATPDITTPAKQQPPSEQHSVSSMPDTSSAVGGDVNEAQSTDIRIPQPEGGDESGEDLNSLDDDVGDTTDLGNVSLKRRRIVQRYFNLMETPEKRDDDRESLTGASSASKGAGRNHAARFAFLLRQPSRASTDTEEDSIMDVLDAQRGFDATRSARRAQRLDDVHTDGFSTPSMRLHREDQSEQLYESFAHDFDTIGASIDNLNVHDTPLPSRGAYVLGKHHDMAASNQLINMLNDYIRLRQRDQTASNQLTDMLYDHVRCNPDDLEPIGRLTDMLNDYVDASETSEAYTCSFPDVDDEDAIDLAASKQLVEVLNASVEASNTSQQGRQWSTDAAGDSARREATQIEPTAPVNSVRQSERTPRKRKQREVDEPEELPSSKKARVDRSIGTGNSTEQKDSGRRERVVVEVETPARSAVRTQIGQTEKGECETRASDSPEKDDVSPRIGLTTPPHRFRPDAQSLPQADAPRTPRPASRLKGSAIADESSEDDDNTTPLSKAERADIVFDFSAEKARRWSNAVSAPEDDWCHEERELFLRLAMRGFEPLLPAQWKADFSTVPSTVFGDGAQGTQPMIQVGRGSNFYAIRALQELLAVGGRVRDCAVLGTSEEQVIKRALRQYIKWAFYDANLSHRARKIPVYAIESQKRDEETAFEALVRLNSRLESLAVRYRQSGRHSENIHPTYPVLTGFVITGPAVLIMVLNTDPNNTATNPDGSASRYLCQFDISDYGQDVWNALGLAIATWHIRTTQHQLVFESDQGHWNFSTDANSDADEDL